MVTLEEITIAQLREDNDTLRGILAFENVNCLYCQLPLNEMVKCQSGFPGCARADDMLCAPATIQARYEKHDPV
jgi:hypothetical protein